ncbi:60S ribosomal protein L44 [Lemmus lemmus]
MWQAPTPQSSTVQEGGKRRYDSKQSGYGGQTKPISAKRGKLQRRLC